MTVSTKWLPIAKRYPVKYAGQQMALAKQMKGVVIHTTNAWALNTIKDVQNNWPGPAGQAAHFVIDRDGNIGQCFPLDEIAWHVSGGTPKTSTLFYGIEHIARHKQALTSRQLEASARLIGDLSSMFKFPTKRYSTKTKDGIAIHVDFQPTGCGQNVFWHSTTSYRTNVFNNLVKRANDFATLGY